MDTADLRQVVRAALQTTSDAEMLGVIMDSDSEEEEDNLRPAFPLRPPPNQREEPPTIFIDHVKELPEDALPFQLRGRIWAINNHHYLKKPISYAVMVF